MTQVDQTVIVDTVTASMSIDVTGDSADVTVDLGSTAD